MSNQQQQQQQQPTHRSLTGVVTKLVGDGATYGFINDEIFFPQTNVSGGPASVGDQVFAECQYSAHMPIKWNATSVKIINKAVSSTQHQQSGASGQPQQQQMQQQDLMNQQQFNQGSPSVAVTYQQHRQQRQQRQMMDIKPDETIMKQEHQQQQQQQSMEQNHQARLLDQQQQHHTINNPNDIFGPPNTRSNFPMQQQQPDSGIQPFHDQPMGPPNFTYTSQLGSAFVQNQFIQTPFLTQQPPPMLPQQQPPQHLLSSNQPVVQQQQRHDQHNKGMGGRFNNHSGDNKNDRQNNRRNMNRNDNNKFDRPRSGDRDSNRQSKNNSRERSTGRTSKRDDVPVRPSPPPHSSAKSTTSINSDKGKNRRHYEVQNLPKIQIMTNMNAYNMKQRCPSSVHVPSDLKNVIVNSHFRLDLKNTPKPILFRIEHKKDSKPEENIGLATDPKDSTEAAQDDDQTSVKHDDSFDPNKKDSKLEQSTKSNQEQQTPPASKSDVKLNHKYGVKVILVSIPEFDTIYRSVFGEKLDSYSAEGRFSYKKLDELITLLCNKGSNNGYSLIGGKFDPITDGFVEGETNDLERHGRKPDLIATCKRVVIEQVGLDLSNCMSWTLLSTFMYNNKSDYFSSKASIEYSHIYMPDIWSLLTNKFDTKVLDKESLIQSQQEQEKEKQPLTINEKVNTQAEESTESNDMLKESIHSNETTAPICQDSVEAQTTIKTASNEASETINDDSLNDMKVTDLKVELDKRNIKYKAGMKKAELIELLQENSKSNEGVQEETTSTVADNFEIQAAIEINQDGQQTSKTLEVEEERQLEEGEVLPGPSEANSPDNSDDFDDEIVDGKRKGSYLDSSLKRTTKKLCQDKKQHIDLIKESFTVYATEQQQLSLVPLFEATQAGRYDQFELSVSSNILKESIIQHFSEYILTTLVEDYKQKMSTSINVNQNSSSQDTNSDTNNNSTTTKAGNNNNISNATKNSTNNTNIKEYQVDRYINLALTYFDSSHMGYVYFEDLNKLFNNTGLTISKRALMALIGDGDKFNYRTLADLSPKLPPTYTYEFPIQFNQLPGTCSQVSSSTTISNVKLVEHRGVVYDVEKLIQQVKDAETLSVNLVDRFNYAIENSDKQIDEIHVLEVSQKSLSKAIKAQNDEICELKRERDSIKKKYDSVRKGIKGTISSLSDLIKDETK